MNTTTTAAMPTSNTRQKQSITTLSDFRSKLQELINILSESNSATPVTQHLSQHDESYSLSADLGDITVSFNLTTK